MGRAFWRGRGWLWRAQQDTTSELNNMLQIGDYRTEEGVLVVFTEEV